MAKQLPRTKGSWAEDLAIEYLIARDLQFITRNYYSRFGELDIVMVDQGELVVVEVKSSFDEEIDPMANMSLRKVKRLFLTVNDYLQRQEHFVEFRVDFVGITKTELGYQYNWIRDLEVM